jgi:hypothetical protein
VLLDLQHVLLDARGRSRRLLALQARERFLVFLVGEVKADPARDQQRAADQGEDQQEVLAEELAAVQAPGRRLPRGRLLFDDRLYRFQALPPLRFTLSPRPRAPTHVAGS